MSVEERRGEDRRPVVHVDICGPVIERQGNLDGRRAASPPIAHGVALVEHGVVSGAFINPNFAAAHGHLGHGVGRRWAVGIYSHSPFGAGAPDELARSRRTFLSIRGLRSPIISLAAILRRLASATRQCSYVRVSQEATVFTSPVWRRLDGLRRRIQRSIASRSCSRRFRLPGFSRTLLTCPVRWSNLSMECIRPDCNKVLGLGCRCSLSAFGT